MIVEAFGRGWAAVRQTPPSRRDVCFALAVLPLLAFGTLGSELIQQAPRRLDGWAFTLGYPYGPIQLCLVLAIFEVARRYPPKISLPICLAVTAVSTAVVLSRSTTGADAPAVVVLLWLSWLVIPWLIGTLVRLRTLATARVRADLIAWGAAEERLKLAREVHDIAGHGFAVVAMQAGVALVAFDDDPRQVRASLEAVQLVSSRALGELRSMLGSFRPITAGSDQPEQPDRFGLAQVRELVDSVRGGGLAVDLCLDPGMTEANDHAMRPEVKQVVYRVVQESLTNVLRHGHTAAARVELSQESGGLLVRVSDRGVGVGALGYRAGRGITGMRGRVLDLGGTMSSGPRSGGGFEVEACLPYAGDPR